MPNLNIYDVNIRTTGRLNNLLLYNCITGESIVEHAAKLGCNAIMYNPFFPTTIAEIEKDGKQMTASLFAATRHDIVSPEFSSVDYKAAFDEAAAIAKDDKIFALLKKKAEEHGVTLIANLVANHVAADHPLVDSVVTRY